MDLLHCMSPEVARCDVGQCIELAVATGGTADAGKVTPIAPDANDPNLPLAGPKSRTAASP